MVLEITGNQLIFGCISTIVVIFPPSFPPSLTPTLLAYMFSSVNLSLFLSPPKAFVAMLICWELLTIE